jgi:Glycosyl transferases group 1
VKFARRVQLVRSVEHLPVSIMSRAPIEAPTPISRLRYIDTRSASEMMNVMADSRCVICPLPHMTGYHERAMGAFTAGAVVVAAPNHILETEFCPGRDLLIYKTEAQLVAMLERLLEDPGGLAEMAKSGRQRAVTQFAPDRLAATVVSLLEQELTEPQWDG